MVTYSCPRCGFNTNHKSKMRAHFNRKNICSPTCSNTTIDECREQVLGHKNDDILKNPHLYPQKSSFSYPHLSSSYPHLSSKYPHLSSSVSSSIPMSQKEDKNICQFCKKEFSSYKNKWRHEKTCRSRESYSIEEVEERIAEKISEKDAIIDELKKQIELLLKEKVNTTTNNNYTQNNYIVINAFGNENLKYITKSDISNIINDSPMTSIPKLLKHIHFNPEHEENHNIVIPNRKNSLTKVYNGQKWVFQKKQRTIEDMTNKAYNTIINNYDENNNKSWKKIIDNIQEDDKPTLGRIQAETELMILNNQDIVKDG